MNTLCGQQSEDHYAFVLADQYQFFFLEESTVFTLRI